MEVKKDIKRNYMIDSAKVICLYLILFCHIPPTGGLWHNFVYLFHVPIFFLIAGMFYKQKPICEVIVSSARTLLLPYLMFNLILVGCSVVITLLGGYGFELKSHVFEPLMGIMLGSSGVATPYRLPGGPSWFLIALFMARVIFAVFLQSSRWMRILECLTLLTMYIVVDNYIGWNPFSMNGAILGLPFLALGYVFKGRIFELINKSAKIKLGAILVISVLLYAMAYFNGLSDMFNGEYGNYYILFLLGGLAGSIMVLMIASFFNQSNEITKLIIEGSTFFICMHMMIMEYVKLVYIRTTGLSHELLPHDKIIISLVVVTVVLGCLVLMRKCTPKLLKV